MNGIHDMGGMDGFGSVEPEPNEPPFHSRWEGRSLAMNRIMSYAKIWNIDRSRAAIEELPPSDYLGMTYYEKWAARLEKLLLEYGLICAGIAIFILAALNTTGQELLAKLTFLLNMLG